MKLIQCFALLQSVAYFLSYSLPRTTQTMIGVCTILSVISSRAMAARETSLGIYQGRNIDTLFTTTITANTDGSNTLAGFRTYYNASLISNSLYVQLNTAGEINCVHEQNVGGQDIFTTSVVIKNSIFLGGSTSRSGLNQPYISQNSLINCTLQSVWVLTGLSTNFKIQSMTATPQNTLICLCSSPNAGYGVILEFNPSTGIVLSASSISPTLYSGQVNSMVAMSEQDSYLIGGITSTNPVKGWLTAIKNTGGTWSEIWTRFYSASNNMGVYIQAVSAKNTTASFAGYLNNGVDNNVAVVGSINTTSSNANWIDSISGVSLNMLYGVTFKSGVSPNDESELLLSGLTGVTSQEI